MFSSKIKSTPLTLDTYENNSSTFGISLFEKDLHQVSNSNFNFSSLDPQNFDLEKPNLFTLRANIDHRQRYIYRVLGDKKNQQLPSIKHQHVFIYDWDDTLLFTTYLKSKKNHELSQNMKKCLNQLDDIVLSILDYSLKKGFVFIITNAVDGWIKYSSKLYLPKVHQKIISQNKLIIWSARRQFQQLYPNDLKMWKIAAFKKLRLHLKTNILTNVICVGDRQDDLEACDVLVNQFDLIYIKKIKLEEKPKPQELIKQLKLLQKKLQQIFHAITNTTIKLEKRVLTPENIRRNSEREEFSSQKNGSKKQRK